MTEGRPARHGATFSEIANPATTNGQVHTASLPDAADLLEGVFVVLVARKVDGETRYRRRIFLDLRAAERHAARQTMNGHRTAVTLCRLAPVHEFAGGWSA
ncbi:hypothetical protein GI686_10600 [Micrococcus sp. JV4]|uniref:hypothetical protein n=1 Tax=unclassified Micrococcus TaxID=2620948 RepID=UPI000B24B31C|nr:MULTISPECIES: hypothetical protein [unclassified Micrococcus]MBM4624993.1 hypothetical protein [Micrococcus sp. JV4]RYD01137.1 hypothetical protein SJ20_00505 [Micrococcus sp. MS-ASIII-49]